MIFTAYLRLIFYEEEMSVRQYVTDAKLKLAKHQAKAKQYSEAELSLFENYSLSSSPISSKNTLFLYKQLGSGLNLQSCLYFRGF